MRFTQSLIKIWKTRDELSPHNFRVSKFSIFFILPLVIIIGDLRFLDQQIAIFGIDSNSLIMIFFGIGFLPIFFIKEEYVFLLLKIAVVLQFALLATQLVLAPSMVRVVVYLLFHALNGVCITCGFYIFAFALNNVERLITLLIVQLYYAFTYLLLPTGLVTALSRIIVPSIVMLALFIIVMFNKNLTKSADKQESKLSVNESGISIIALLYVIYYVISLMAMYIVYQEESVSSFLYSAGGFLSIVIIVIIMLIFNCSALHLWTLCLVCSVIGIGTLYYKSAFAINTGSFLYGLGEGLGFMILLYLMGGAVKRSGSFKVLKIFCLFACIGYVVITLVFDILYRLVNSSNHTLAFPTVLILALVCFLVAPILQRKLFLTDWTDGYHMTDMPIYTETLAQVEQVNKDKLLDLTPREKEIFTMLLTDVSPKEIASILKISTGTFNFHSSNLYRKLEIQSRTELFANYSDMVPE